MKSLIKLRLINWHYFVNTTTDIRNLTFLTGPNGTGKSTVIDAIQILIEGTTNPSNFNKAANEKGKSGRSLLGYLKGQVGINDDGSTISVRSGNFTSYIALEIEDDVEKKIFTIGALFDVDSKDSVSKHYFYLDSKFPECDFQIKIDNKTTRPMQYKEFATYVKSNYSHGHYQFFDTDIEYHEFTKVAFGNLPDKYFTLFKQAVSFAPISDLSKFITEYVCDADLNVDITSMQSTIQQYKILESEAKRLREKQEKLQNIQTIYDDYVANIDEYNLLNYVDQRVKYEEAKIKDEKVTKEIENLNNRLLSLQSQIYTLDEQNDELNSSLSSYNAKKYQSDNYQITESLANKKKNITEQIVSIQMQVSNVMNKLTKYANDYYDNCSSFYRYYEDFNSNKLDDLSVAFDELKDIVKEVRDSASIIKNQVDTDSLDFTSIQLFRDNMDILKNKVISLQTVVNTKIANVSGKITSIQSQLSNISSGKKPFDLVFGPLYVEIKNALEQALKSRHSDAYVNTFCDLIDINNPEWTTAIEACMYSQKFNFFVNPQYFEESFMIFKEIRNNYIRHMGSFPNSLAIVDTKKLIERNFDCDYNSVATLIDTNDEGARAYANYLLGKIKMCYSFEEARNSETGIGLLADCSGYRSFATWNLDERKGRQRFIGTTVSSDSQAFLTSSLRDMQQLYSLYTELAGQLDQLRALEVISKEELNTYRNDFEKVSNISGLKAKVEDVDNQIHDAAYGDINDIDEQISAINSDLSTIKNDRDNAISEMGSIKNELSRLNSEVLPSCKETIAETKKALELYNQKDVNEKYDPFFNKLLDEQQLTLPQIRQLVTKQITPLMNKQNSNRSSLQRLRAEYCSTYHVNYQIGNFDSNDEFSKALEEISNITLPEYESKIIKAHADSIKEFKDDFIYKLRGTIDSVYAQINDLNLALEQNNFGRDKYQFKVAPNRDYLTYYNMIMDDDLLNHGDAESMFMEKYKVTMNDLFAMISDSSNKVGEEREQILRNIALYTNYTTYLTFDLLVTRGFGDDAKTISLGKSFKSQSGGETQNPFYIAIIASFASVTRVNNTKDSNTLRLVIFDEAFSKMDSTRIMKSTELLKQFKLQTILSTPSEKLRDIANYVDLILVTMHNDRSKKSSLDTYRSKAVEDKFKSEEQAMLESKTSDKDSLSSDEITNYVEAHNKENK